MSIFASNPYECIDCDLRRNICPVCGVCQFCADHENCESLEEADEQTAVQFESQSEGEG